ncbi:MAG: hypothetical protein FIB01_14310 [Gemmatimonadetes bacterium]|nr:hypothetical protein [Gemmatimonadota bacterium]
MLGASSKPRRTALAAALPMLLAACELQEVTSTTGADFVVAEVVLEAGADSQYAYLHRALGQGGMRIPDARIAVSDAAGRVLEFHPVDYWRCLQPEPARPSAAGSCYAASALGLPIQPGETYGLRIRTSSGAELAGSTKVPAALQLRQPRTGSCALVPDTSLELRWGAVEGAWVYDVEARFTDIFPILVQRGVVADTPNVPLRLEGLAISANDTTLVLPGELGLFDRFDPALHPILMALSSGLPEGVSAEVVIAAADRNYVNWVRGDSFNPSGAVRIASVHGAGTGVFGSFSSARIRLRVTRDGSLPACF